MSERFAEPWTRTGYVVTAGEHGGDSFEVVATPWHKSAYAERAVGCVNLLAGVDDLEAFERHLRALLGLCYLARNDSGLSAAAILVEQHLAQPPARALVRAACERLGLTQKALADRMNVSEDSVSRWSLGHSEPAGAALPLLGVLAGKRDA